MSPLGIFWRSNDLERLFEQRYDVLRRVEECETLLGLSVSGTLRGTK